MIVCPRCSKQNQDHYKFCLGCGSELPRDAAREAKRFSRKTPVPEAPQAQEAQGDIALAQTHASEPLPGSQPQAAQPEPAASVPGGVRQAAVISDRPSAESVTCSSCGNPVPSDFKFCGTCGHRMSSGGAPAQEPAPAAPAPAAAQAEGVLVLINPDGSEGARLALGAGSTVIGRESGGVFAADAYLSPTHASFTLGGGELVVRDEGSLNGVYRKLGQNEPIVLTDGAVFRIGQEVLRYEELAEPEYVDGVEKMGSPNPGYLGRVCLIVGRNNIGNAFPIPPDGMHLGRERGDVLFPEDGYVSGLHCRIHSDGQSVLLTDVGSSNGTFLRVRKEQKVHNGDLLLMGQQLFRAEF